MLFIIFNVFYSSIYPTIDIGPKENFTILYFQPFDQIKLHMPYNVLSVLSNWKKADGLFVEIESIDMYGTVESHGKFDNDCRLLGVYFENRNYTLKFTFEGIDEFKLAMLFLRNNFTKSLRNYNNSYVYEKYDFPLKSIPTKMESLIFDDRNGLKYFYITFFVILGIDIIYSFFTVCYAIS